MQQNKMVNRKDEKSSMENEPQRLNQEGMEESDLNKSKMGPDEQTDRQAGLEGGPGQGQAPPSTDRN